MSLLEKEKDSLPAKYRSRIRTALKLVRRNKEATVGFSIVSFFVILAVVVEIANLLQVTITPYSPLKSVGPPLAAPSLAHLFGTDLVGRDVFSRIVVATPNDVAVGFGVAAFAMVVGLIVGSVAAFRGGLLDELLMRFTDVIFALPALIIAMVIAVALGPGVTHMMVALMIIWWPPYARLARGEALKVAHQNYIEASRLSGQKPRRILLRHILPNISGTMLVYATLDIGTVILVYSGLTFLGLGNRPPAPDWGQMVASYNGYLLSDPWLAAIPGLVISLGVVGFSLLGDGIKDSLGIR